LIALVRMVGLLASWLAGLLGPQPEPLCGIQIHILGSARCTLAPPASAAHLHCAAQPRCCATSPLPVEPATACGRAQAALATRLPAAAISSGASGAQDVGAPLRECLRATFQGGGSSAWPLLALTCTEGLCSSSPPCTRPRRPGSTFRGLAFGAAPPPHRSHRLPCGGGGAARRQASLPGSARAARPALPLCIIDGGRKAFAHWRIWHIASSRPGASRALGQLMRKDDDDYVATQSRLFLAHTHTHGYPAPDGSGAPQAGPRTHHPFPCDPHVSDAYQTCTYPVQLADSYGQAACQAPTRGLAVHEGWRQRLQPVLRTDSTGCAPFAIEGLAGSAWQPERWHAWLSSAVTCNTRGCCALMPRLPGATRSAASGALGHRFSIVNF
jgi:hypothetical protein